MSFCVSTIPREILLRVTRPRHTLSETVLFHFWLNVCSVKCLPSLCSRSCGTRFLRVPQEAWNVRNCRLAKCMFYIIANLFYTCHLAPLEYWYFKYLLGLIANIARMLHKSWSAMCLAQNGLRCPCNHKNLIHLFMLEVAREREVRDIDSDMNAPFLASSCRFPHLFTKCILFVRVTPYITLPQRETVHVVHVSSSHLPSFSTTRDPRKPTPFLTTSHGAHHSAMGEFPREARSYPTHEWMKFYRTNLTLVLALHLSFPCVLLPIQTRACVT